LLRLWIVRVCKLASFLWSPDHTLIAHGVEPRARACAGSVRVCGRGIRHDASRL